MSDDIKLVDTPIEQPTQEEIEQYPTMPETLPVVEDNTAEEK